MKKTEYLDIKNLPDDLYKKEIKKLIWASRSLGFTWGLGFTLLIMYILL